MDAMSKKARPLSDTPVEDDIVRSINGDVTVKSAKSGVISKEKAAKADEAHSNKSLHTKAKEKTEEALTAVHKTAKTVWITVMTAKTANAVFSLKALYMIESLDLVGYELDFFFL